jgi:hypothetical protein
MKSKRLMVLMIGLLSVVGCCAMDQVDHDNRMQAANDIFSSIFSDELKRVSEQRASSAAQDYQALLQILQNVEQKKQELEQKKQDAQEQEEARKCDSDKMHKEYLQTIVDRELQHKQKMAKANQELLQQQQQFDAQYGGRLSGAATQRSGFADQRTKADQAKKQGKKELSNKVNTRLGSQLFVVGVFVCAASAWYKFYTKEESTPVNGITLYEFDENDEQNENKKNMVVEV